MLPEQSKGAEAHCRWGGWPFYAGHEVPRGCPLFHTEWQGNGKWSWHLCTTHNVQGHSEFYQVSYFHILKKHKMVL